MCCICFCTSQSVHPWMVIRMVAKISTQAEDVRILRAPFLLRFPPCTRSEFSAKAEIQTTRVLQIVSHVQSAYVLLLIVAWIPSSWGNRWWWTRRVRHNLYEVTFFVPTVPHPQRHLGLMAGFTVPPSRRHHDEGQDPGQFAIRATLGWFTTSKHLLIKRGLRLKCSNDRIGLAEPMSLAGKFMIDH